MDAQSLDKRKFLIWLGIAATATVFGGPIGVLISGKAGAVVGGVAAGLGNDIFAAHLNEFVTKNCVRALDPNDINHDLARIFKNAHLLAVMAVLLSSCQRGYYGGGYGGRGYGCPGRITQQTEQQPAVVPQPVITDIDC